MSRSRVVLRNVVSFLRKPQIQLELEYQKSNSWSVPIHHNATLSTKSLERRYYSSTSILNDGSYEEFRKPLSSSQRKDLESEVVHTHRRLDQDLCQYMLKELLSLNETSPPMSPPEFGPAGTWKYQSQNENGGLLYTRRFNDANQVVLDLAPDEQVHSMSLSVDESLIAYLISDEKGEEHIRIRHIQSGMEISVNMSSATNSLVSLEFGPILPNTTERHGFYVVGADEQGRPDRVYAGVVTVDVSRSEVVLDAVDPTTIFQSDEPAVMVDVQRTKGCHYVAIQARTKIRNEIFLSSDPTAALITTIPKEENLQYHLDVGEKNDVVILVSENGEEYRVIEATVDSLPLNASNYLEYQTDELQPDADYAISDMDIFRDHLVFYDRSTSNGLERIRTHRRDALESPPVVVPLPSINAECYKLSAGGNIYFGSHNISFKVESPVDAGLVYDFDMKSNELKVSAASRPMTETAEIEDVICTERVFVPSEDGTKVPLSLIYKDKESKGEKSFFNRLLGSREQSASPIVLVGYGAYGEPADLQYSPSWATLLKRGYIVAFAHTRGGGDLGREWYHRGCRENKVKAIEDFEACAHYLRRRYASEKLTAMAFSAGGVIVGAAMNRDPELFDNVVLTNAFVDVYETMTNPDLFLTSHEWDEYGSPLHDADDANRIRSYCPTTNLSSMSTCPQTLLVGTLDDENVPFWNAVIFAKKLRDCIQDKDRVHLHLEARGGHHLGSRRLHVSALELAFIVQNSEAVE
jgi:protease II